MQHFRTESHLKAGPKGNLDGTPLIACVIFRWRWGGLYDRQAVRKGLIGSQGEVTYSVEWLYLIAWKLGIIIKNVSINLTHISKRNEDGIWENNSSCLHMCKKNYLNYIECNWVSPSMVMTIYILMFKKLISHPTVC